MTSVTRVLLQNTLHPLKNNNYCFDDYANATWYDRATFHVYCTLGISLKRTLLENGSLHNKGNRERQTRELECETGAAAQVKVRELPDCVLYLEEASEFGV